MPVALFNAAFSSVMPWVAAVVMLCASGCASNGAQPGSSNEEGGAAQSEASTSVAAAQATGAQTGATPGAAATGAGTTAGNSNVAKAPIALVTPALSAQSPAVQATTGAGAGVNLPNVVFVDSAASATSTMTGTSKQFEVTALDYDVCPFYYAHAQTSAGVYSYKVAPSATFNFSGLYLVNGAPGQALVAGTYTVGASSGLQVVTDSHTSGINFDVEACKIKNFQGFSSGSVTLDAISTDGKHAPVSGRFDLTTTDGGNLMGAFTVGHCTAGNTVYPVAPTPDPDACTL